MRFRGAGVVVLAALVVGCNGGDEEADTEPPQGRADSEGMTRAEYVDRLDAICEEGDERAEEFDRRIEEAQERELSLSEQFETFNRILEEALPAQEELLEEAEQLNPPPGEQEFHSAYMGYVRDNLLFARRAAEAAEREDVQTFNVMVEEVERVQSKSDGLVQGHGGFEHCGEEE